MYIYCSGSWHDLEPPSVIICVPVSMFPVAKEALYDVSFKQDGYPLDSGPPGKATIHGATGEPQTKVLWGNLSQGDSRLKQNPDPVKTAGPGRVAPL